MELNGKICGSVKFTRNIYSVVSRKHVCLDAIGQRSNLLGLALLFCQLHILLPPTLIAVTQPIKSSRSKYWAK